MYRKIWRVTKLALIVVVAGVLVGETVARFGLGLGDPPLSMPHPDIEYMFRPCQDCMRFGNRVRYNAYSMRSDDFPSRKTDPNELRVLVIGDSVINGGSLTDQSELATEIAADRLSEELGRPVLVGNISAGSWGPGNQLAYVRLYGLFDSDVVVLVLSSHDADDIPSFDSVVGVRSSFPAERPYSALAEAITRYLPQYLPRWAGEEEETGATGSSSSTGKEWVFGSKPAIVGLFEETKAAGAVPIVIQHPECEELDGNFQTGHAMIAACAAEHGVAVRQFRPRLASAVEVGQQPYRDVIHLSPRGQQLLAAELVDAVMDVLSRGVGHGPQSRQAQR